MIIGKLNNISIGTNVLQKELEIEWKISKFSSFPKKCGYKFDSPSFDFADVSWFLEIVLRGHQKKNANGCIGLYLMRKSSGPSINMKFTLGLKTFDGKKDSEHHRQFNFRNNDVGYGVHACIKRSELYERQPDLMPYDDLTVFCNLKYPKKYEDTSLSDNVTTKSSYCQTTLEAEDDISPCQGKCLEKSLQCPECGDFITLKNWDEHKCLTMKLKVSEKLLNDLEKMMLNGEHSDMIIKVKEVDFRLHKTILAARNPFFHAMFNNAMKEKTTGIISIDDCKPDIFRSFIYFVYTGKVDQLSLENVCDLYEVADKYQEDILKEECLHFMINMISTDSFCDFIVLALKYNEKKLLQNATEFFCSKAKEIIRDVKWQTFMVEYPTQANELYIKAFNHSDDK